jgi:ribosomal protein S27E
MTARWRTNWFIKRLCPGCGGIQWLQSKFGTSQRWKCKGCGREDECEQQGKGGDGRNAHRAIL